jgi:DNA polymerase-3 subunit gamma/tau
VLEFDAATHSKVDQVRELTESLKYGPGRNRYKIIILDEIHRLSRQAFDALLKIVEEPPQHLVFIFATTEAEAVPATILSRCQEFRFRRVPIEELAQHLEMICREESIEASPSALRLIARAGDGSVRDAVALADQLATFGAGQIQDEDAANLLGGLGFELLRRLLVAISCGRSKEVSSIVVEIDNQGWDPRHVFGEFLSYCRTALQLGLGADPQRAGLPAEEAEELTRLAQDTGYENLLRVLHLLLESEATVRRSESGSLAVEVAWLRAAELPKLLKVEELLALGGPTTPPTPPQPPSRREQEPATPLKRPALNPQSSKPSVARTPPSAHAVGEPPVDRTTTVETGPVTSFIEHLSRHKQSLAAHLVEAENLFMSEGVLTIFSPPGDTWLRETLNRPTNIKLLEDALAAVWGPGVEWRLREGSGRLAAAKDPDGRANGSPPDLEEALEDPRVQTVLDIFGGSVESIDESPTTSEGPEE